MEWIKIEYQKNSLPSPNKTNLLFPSYSNRFVSYIVYLLLSSSLSACNNIIYSWNVDEIWVFFTSVLIFNIYNLAHINEQKRIKIKEKFKPPFGNKCRFSRDDIESGRHF